MEMSGCGRVNMQLPKIKGNNIYFNNFRSSASKNIMPNAFTNLMAYWEDAQRTPGMKIYFQHRIIILSIQQHI